MTQKSRQKERLERSLDRGRYLYGLLTYLLKLSVILVTVPVTILMGFALLFSVSILFFWSGILILILIGVLLVLWLIRWLLVKWLFARYH